MRRLALLVACAPAYLPTSGGPCIESIRAGRSRYFYHDGEPVRAARLERFLARDPNEKYAVEEMGHLRRAGWSLAAIGYLMLPVSLGLFLGKQNADGSLPTWVEATGGTLLAAWFPTVLTGVLLGSIAQSELRDAVNRRNARGPCPDF
jgi:anti-sigma factor RsiW